MASSVTKERKEYRIWDDVNKVWNLLFFRTNAKSVDAADGKTLETKIGKINGITSDINGESDSIAASIKCVNALKNNHLGGFTPVIDSTGKITGYKTKVGADTVFPFSNTNQQIVDFYSADGEQIAHQERNVSHTFNYTGTCCLVGFALNTGSMGGTADYIIYLNDVEVFKYTCGSNAHDWNYCSRIINVKKGDIIKMSSKAGSSGYGYFSNRTFLILIKT